MNITREEVKEIVDDIYKAGFWMYGVGNFNIDKDELCNILMIALTKDNRELHLNRYYKILHDKVFVGDKMCRGRIDG